jgi:hypothetical protein
VGPENHLKGDSMLHRMLILAAAVALPATLAGQDIPNSHASDTAKAKVAAHRQTHQVPAPEASDTAKSKVAQHAATHIQGSVLGLDNRPVTPATRAVPATKATPAIPGAGGAATPASPAAPATPAVPASPSKKPSSPGQSAGHRP